MLAILLFFLGLILVVLEVFFPSFGVLTISALAAFTVSIFVAFGESTGMGFTMLFVTLFAVPAVVWFALKQLPKTPLGKKLFTSGPPPSPSDTALITKPVVVGAIGTTSSELRPSGTVDLDGERVDVVTEGEFIDRGARVRVVEVEGNRVVVELVESDEAETTETRKKKPRWA